ncbi:MAG TPA: hypothetical protein VFT56_02395 [Sphingomonas sp.]|nr:hypothetical protein [Sphingomonas sp.]
MMTPRVTWEALQKSTEAEPGRRMSPGGPITLHDASMAPHMDAAAHKVNRDATLGTMARLIGRGERR